MCSGTVNIGSGNSGRISMPTPFSTSVYYASNLDCYWQFGFAAGDTISFSVVEFNTEANYDFVSLSSGQQYSGSASSIASS
jgi:hypothetical protein